MNNWVGKKTLFQFPNYSEARFAPLIQWVEPTERKLLVAPSDLLSFSALAQDDLGLARVEYLIKKNQGKWEALLSPTCLTLVVKIQWQLTLTWTCFYREFKPGTQALLKLRARDLKELIRKQKQLSCRLSHEILNSVASIYWKRRQWFLSISM